MAEPQKERLLEHDKEAALLGALFALTFGGGHMRRTCLPFYCTVALFTL